MNNLSFCWNCWIRCVEIDVICVALIFFQFFLFCNSCNIEVFSTFLLTAFPCKYVLLQLWKMFLVLTVWLIPANGWLSNTTAYFFPSQVKWVCAACNRRKIQCLLCRSHGLAVLGATAPWLRYIVHLCRSFLGFHVLLLNYILPLDLCRSF